MESSCHNPKMAAYCQEVQQLEDKFDDFELNHIPRWVNKVANMLAMAASGQGPVSTGVFANTSPRSTMRS
jgi:hypothetical protein